MITRKDLESLERKILAPYAMKSGDSRGRRFRESEHPYRTRYQRDRDRIIHSTAFRRLEYKTQVFVNHEGDYYRTRLTHSLEAAQIGRSIASVLRLNPDLTEAIILAHDLGHTPFGHAGEEALADLMKDHGGFDHNRQGLRVIDLLEERYPDFPGLNLSWEVREGMAKHPGVARVLLHQGGGRFPSPLLEAQVADLSDEIAYDNHDLDDGITSELLQEADLLRVPLWKRMVRTVGHRTAALSQEKRKYLIIRSLINAQVTDLIRQTEKNLRASKIKTPSDARRVTERLVRFSSGMAVERKPLRDFLKKHLYQHYRVVRMSDKARRFLKDLFRVYLANPQQLPPTSAHRVETEGPHRAICDYIAGMTDRYALEEYRKLFDPMARV